MGCFVPKDLDGDELASSFGLAGMDFPVEVGAEGEEVAAEVGS
jgi:hypothetical protein